MLEELVAKPIPNARQAGFPRNRAKVLSSSLTTSRVPAEDINHMQRVCGQPHTAATQLHPSEPYTQTIVVQWPQQYIRNCNDFISCCSNCMEYINFRERVVLEYLFEIIRNFHLKGLIKDNTHYKVYPPSSLLTLRHPAPYLWVASKAASAQGPVLCANPR